MLCPARGGAIVDIAASVDEKSGVFARKLWVELKSRPRPTRRSADRSASTSAILLVDHRLEALVVFRGLAAADASDQETPRQSSSSFKSQLAPKAWE
jgi:hypothetical protein